MSDLISRQDAIDEIREVYEYEFPTASGEFDEFVVSIIPNILRNLPSEEPEKKNGKWIKEDRGHVEYTGVCSECGFSSIWYDTQEYFNFCPNCGARMTRGEE